MIEKIKKLAQKRNAIILAHNYQPPEIQDIADLCGDSLELSIKASQTNADVIVFCGVHFMAETACILCPDKKVLLPKSDAGCPMADMVTEKQLSEKIKELPSVSIVTYVNSSAAVKALSSICCTSANVVNIVEKIDSNEILMIPDKNLASYAASKTSKKIHLWNGYCPFHDSLTPEDVYAAKKEHPDALFIAHPECRKEVLDLADAVLSTSGMIHYTSQSDASSFIIGTEIGILYPLKKENPDKNFYPANSKKMECADMKKIKLDDVLRSLEFMEGEVTVPEDIRKKALNAVKLMLQF
ncbi:MAG: quinolinate synthase NadA [Desulfobacterales bacterium]|nr:quinolinate synthase NadA [Desulfobacterales bacterium]